MGCMAAKLPYFQHNLLLSMLWIIPGEEEKLAPAKDTLPPSATPNPWLPIVQTTLVHPNEHLCKAQRALWHYAECFGGTGRGAFASLAQLSSPTNATSGEAPVAQGVVGLDGAVVAVREQHIPVRFVNSAGALLLACLDTK